MDATTVLPNSWTIQKHAISETQQEDGAVDKAGAQNCADCSPAAEEPRFDCRAFVDDNDNRTVDEAGMTTGYRRRKVQFKFILKMGQPGGAYGVNGECRALANRVAE
jgi:hypothetical protein